MTLLDWLLLFIITAPMPCHGVLMFFSLPHVAPALRFRFFRFLYLQGEYLSGQMELRAGEVASVDDGLLTGCLLA